MKNLESGLSKRSLAAMLFLLASMPMLIVAYPQADDISQWVHKLKTGNSDARRNAVLHLSSIEDPRVVKYLTIALKDMDTGVRRMAAICLCTKADAQAVLPLIAALQDKDADVRSYAALILGNLKDVRAVQPLIAATKNKDANFRRVLAYALAEMNDARAEKFLMSAYDNRDLAIVAGATRFFIRKALPESEPLLVEALNGFGNEITAEDFYNCDNDRLKEAATNWANVKSIQLSENSDSPKWGKD